MKRIIALLISVIMVFALVACDTEEQNTPNTPENPGTQQPETPETPETPEIPEIPEVVLPPETTYDTPTASELLKDQMGVFNENTYADNTTWPSFMADIDVDVSKDANNETYVIGEGGTYRLFGTSLNGLIYIEAPEEDVYLVLDGVNLTNTAGKPAILAKSCASVTIIVNEGTVNYLSDTDKNGENGVITIRSCGLTIDGKGTLNITANKKHGISCKNDITINGGIYNITTPQENVDAKLGGHGIYGQTGLTINSGKYTINAGKSGLKSGDDEDKQVGFVEINYGDINITSAKNGINAYGSVAINGGFIKINSTGGNGIEATRPLSIVENVSTPIVDLSVKNASVVINSYKSALSASSEDSTLKVGNVEITEKTNLKISTTGNGISANNVAIDTSGLIYISTSAVYEKSDITNIDETLYVIVSKKYVPYDAEVHGKKVTVYTRRNCKGIKADNSLNITSGVIGIDAFEDAINCLKLNVLAGEMLLTTGNDGIEAHEAKISGENTKLTVLSAEKGIRIEALTTGAEAIQGTLEISGGTITLNANTDSIKSPDTTISGGKVFLFDKIDKDYDVGEEIETGSVEVNGGIVVMLSTSKNLQKTSGTQSYKSGAFTAKEKCVFDAYVKITAGENVFVLKLPKSYIADAKLYYSSPDTVNYVSVDFGIYEGGNELSSYVYTDGTFTSEQNEIIG